MGGPPLGGKSVKLLSGREVVPFALALLAFVYGAFATRSFLDFHYLLNHTSLFIEVGILALGMTFVIVSGQIDLSVGSILSLTACSSAFLLHRGYSTPVAILCACLLGAALGWVNGWLVGKLKLPSFVVTLGTMAVYRGLAQILMQSKSLPFPLLALEHLPVSAEICFLICFLLLALASLLTLHRTVFGRWIYTVGQNARASLYAGVPVAGVTASVFVLSGLFAGVAGLVMNTRLGLARHDHGLGSELDAITAVVLGGASIYGGSGTIPGTLIALLLLGVVRTEMGIANVTPEYQLAVVGSLLVLSVLGGNLLDRVWVSIRARTVAA